MNETASNFLKWLHCLALPSTMFDVGKAQSWHSPAFDIVSFVILATLGGCGGTSLILICSSLVTSEVSVQLSFIFSPALVFFFLLLKRIPQTREFRKSKDLLLTWKSKGMVLASAQLLLCYILIWE
jgi:hypothetical protein